MTCWLDSFVQGSGGIFKNNSSSHDSIFPTSHYSFFDFFSLILCDIRFQSPYRYFNCNILDFQGNVVVYFDFRTMMYVVFVTKKMVTSVKWKKKAQTQMVIHQLTRKLLRVCRKHIGNPQNVASSLQNTTPIARTRQAVLRVVWECKKFSITLRIVNGKIMTVPYANNLLHSVGIMQSLALCHCRVSSAILLSAILPSAILSSSMSSAILLAYKKQT